MTRDTPHRAPPLVTVLGATGFLGAAVTAALARRPVRVRAVARRPVPLDDVRAGPLLDRRRLDLSAPGAVAAAVAGSDAVIDLVAAEHADGWRGETDGGGRGTGAPGLLRELLDALRTRRPRSPGGRAPVVLLASTVMPGAPASAYERGKATAERCLRDAVSAGTARGGALRLPTVCGPPLSPTAADRGVVTAMTRRALAGLPLTMWHDGSVRRDPVDVRDVADALVAALDCADDLAGGAWDVGGDHPVTVRELFTAIAEQVSDRTGLPPVPVTAVEPPGHAVAADFVDVVADSSALRAATGWRPRFGLRETLSDTVAALEGGPGAHEHEAACGRTGT